MCLRPPTMARTKSRSETCFCIMPASPLTTPSKASTQTSPMTSYWSGFTQLRCSTQSALRQSTQIYQWSLCNWLLNALRKCRCGPTLSKRFSVHWGWREPCTCRRRLSSALRLWRHRLTLDGERKQSDVKCMIQLRIFVAESVVMLEYLATRTT